MCSSSPDQGLALDLISPMEQLTIKSTKEDLMNQLKQHDLYFVTWLRDEPITTEIAAKLLKKLYENVPRVDFDEKDFEALTELGMTTIQSVGCGLIEAYFRICTREFEKFIEIMDLVHKFMKHCDLIIPKDYLVGFEFMISLLKFHLSLEDGSFADADLPLGEMEKQSNLLGRSAQDFKPLELTAILSMRWELNETFISRRLEAIENLEKLCELDPTCWVWSYLLCMRVRYIRRSKWADVGRSHPDPREISASWSSVQNAPKNARPIAEAGMCLVLAEILRWRTISRIESLKELSFGPLTFQSNEKIVNFILDMSKKALENEVVDFGELIRYGEILSSTMPPEYQDPDTAEKCYRQAWTDFPENSKINHKLGSLFIKFRNDKAEAMKYLERAVEFAPMNIQAWMDIILLLMSELQEEQNVPRLKDIFSKLLLPGLEWENNIQKARIIFLNGLFFLLIGETEAAISAWLERIRVDPSENHDSYHSIPSMLKRYSFNRAIRLAPCFETIIEAIRHKLETSPASDDGQELKNMMEKLNEVKERIQPRRQHRSSYNDNDNNYDEGQSYRRRPQPIPSAADSDDCWRTSAAPISVSAPVYESNQSFSRYGYRNANNNTQPQPWTSNYGNRGGGDGNRAGNYSTRNRNSYSVGSGDGPGQGYGQGQGQGHGNWKGQRQHQRERRSPSPDNWRN